MAVPERLIGYESIQLKGPYEMITLHELELKAAANEHATLRFTGIVSDEKRDICVQKATPDDVVEVLQVVDGNVEKKLFRGRVQSVAVKAINGMYYLEVHASTHTKDMDIKLKSRSFQNNSMTYGELIKEVLTDYDGDCIVDRNVESQPLEYFILQYKETDWCFLKRIASRFGLTLIPEISADKPKFWFGVPEKTEAVELDDFHYVIKRDLINHAISAQNYDDTLMETDFTCYELESNQFLPIGARAKCKGIEFVIAQSTTAMKSGALKYLYTLRIETGVRQNEILNNKLIGAMLEGTVKEVESDQVKIDLEIDKGEIPKNYTLFPYSTFYTAEGNSGWYCMPEVGDTVRLLFPTAYEDEAIVAGSVRKNGAESKKTADPNIRYIGTNKGKELKLAPKELLISAKKKGKMLIKLDDDKGIDIQSDGVISVSSKKNLTVETDASLQLTARDGIYLQCRSSSIVLDGEADIKGSVVKVAGTVKAPV